MIKFWIGNNNQIYHYEHCIHSDRNISYFIFYDKDNFLVKDKCHGIYCYLLQNIYNLPKNNNGISFQRPELIKY